MLPALWLRAGAVGGPAGVHAGRALRDPRWHELRHSVQRGLDTEIARKLAANTAVTHAYLVTDSLDAFADQRPQRAQCLERPRLRQATRIVRDNSK